jgi:peptidoglycan-N-acetylglucosamine deacetylase
MGRTRNNPPKTLVTTSWDDGHPLDLRVAERLAAHGMAGTFYVPLRYRTVPCMSVAQMRELQALGMEIGSHTVTHPRLSEIRDDAALQELRESRDALENMLGQPVTSFCYPEGKHRRGLGRLVRAAGYRLARTTLAFHTDLVFDPLTMPVSMQLYPHSRAVLLRHALREGNLSGCFAWLHRLGRESDPVRLAGRIQAHIRQQGGVLHIWGHSWELQNGAMWPLLESVLEGISGQRDVEYVTNAGVLAAVSPSPGPIYANV